MNIYASDEYYMHVMNIIYACDDICDLCEYLWLLEKIEKIKNSSQRAKATALSEGGAQHCAGYSSSRRAEDTALGEEPFFDESQTFGSRRRALLQREPNIWLSAKEWPPLLNCGPGPSARAKDASQRMSAERIQESSRRSPLHRWGFNVWP
jgi:hypothetical protein